MHIHATERAYAARFLCTSVNRVHVPGLVYISIRHMPKRPAPNPLFTVTSVLRLFPVFLLFPPVPVEPSRARQTLERVGNNARERGKESFGKRSISRIFR